MHITCSKISQTAYIPKFCWLKINFFLNETFIQLKLKLRLIDKNINNIAESNKISLNQTKIL